MGGAVAGAVATAVALLTAFEAVGAAADAAAGAAAGATAEGRRSCVPHGRWCRISRCGPAEVCATIDAPLWSAAVRRRRASISERCTITDSMASRVGGVGWVVKAALRLGPRR